MSFLSKSKIIFGRIDIFGRELTFEKDESKNYHTWFGIISSISVFICCIVIGFLFGKEIYERKVPIVSISKEYNNNSTINLDSIPMILLFLNSRG